ncbi:MAG: hypothetical protein HY776_05320 [Actinobacteria bacterium]|nr:hypothetical protein [Actinomycetota bacterium]
MINKFIYFINKLVGSPKDKFWYVIPSSVITDTEKVLKEYGSFNPPHEGIAYWAGSLVKNTFLVSTVIAPKTTSSVGRVLVTQRGNFDFVRILNKINLIQIAQVHSHPTSWINHSFGDDSWAAFKKEGLLSIVVPNYGLKGFGHLANCGCHRYQNNSFIRLSKAYVQNHFKITNNFQSQFLDLRK